MYEQMKAIATLAQQDNKFVPTNTESMRWPVTDVKFDMLSLWKNVIKHKGGTQQDKKFVPTNTVLAN